MEIKSFIGRIWKSSTSHVVTIPASLIDWKIIDLKKEYIFTFKEVKRK
jgi:hypothetical protein